MSRSVIYTVANGKLSAMVPASPESEDTMQRLVADYPEIIADRDGSLLLIRREQPIGDGEGDGRWSLDHLFVTRDGVPVLVELKRATDTRLRREVVGQMLDYAANSTAYWKAGTIADTFSDTVRSAGRDPSEVLREFLGETGDPETFWQRVDDSFAAGRIKLVFVADTIPRELARIVEFLNEQMKADVRAVELNWFEGHGVKAFSPRVIGETERALAAKSGAAGALPPITQEEWIHSRLEKYGEMAVAGGKFFMQAVSEAGGHAEVAKLQGSLVAVFDLPKASIFPMSVSGSKVSLNLIYIQTRPPFDREQARRDLYDKLAEIAGPLSTTNLTGFPAFEIGKLNDPGVRAGVVDLLRNIANAVSSS